MTTPIGYVRYIHRISQNPEQDTVPLPDGFPVDGTLDQVWKALVKTGLSMPRHTGKHHRPRAEQGGYVFFIAKMFHSIIVMPTGSMMHRKHAPPSHRVEDGPLAVTPIIRRPGKFEGQPEYVEYYWGEGLGGCLEDITVDEQPYYVLKVTDHDRKLWPDIDCNYLLLWEDGDGFVESDVLPSIEHATVGMHYFDIFGDKESSDA